MYMLLLGYMMQTVCQKYARGIYTCMDILGGRGNRYLVNMFGANRKQNSSLKTGGVEV